MRILAAPANIGFMVLLAATAAANAADMKLISTNAFRPVISELGPQFERASGHKLVINFVGGPALVKRDIDAGESFDVAISLSPVIDDLVKDGKIVAAAHADVARAGLGVGVRAGAPKPDINSVEAFKRAMLNAKSVAFATEGASGPYFIGLLARFGIAEDMKPKLRPLTTSTAVEAVAKGEAELAVLLIPAIVLAPGLELAGPFPSELQNYLRFAAGSGTGAKQPEGAAALIRFLTSPAAAAVIKAKGMEPGAS
jgi:molybdate transport system substrate-binding protein